MFVTVKTNFTPSFTYDSESPPSGVGQKVMSIVKPAFDVGIIPGADPTHFAPYGDPTGWGLYLIYAAAGLSLYGAYKLVREVL